MVGGLLLVVALLVRLVTIPLPIPFLGDIAFLVGLAGLFTLLCGTTALRRYWFGFFFLIFMVPLPVALYSKIASPLQLLASRVASTVMNATGVPVLCEGNRMTLPGGLQMFVAEACSGMRQLTGFLALTTAVAYLTTRPVWYRVDHHDLGVADRPVGEHRPGDADRLHHAFRQSAVRPGDIPYPRGLADDGIRTVVAPLRVLHAGSISFSSPRTSRKKLRRDSMHTPARPLRGRLVLKRARVARCNMADSGRSSKSIQGGTDVDDFYARCSAARSCRPAWRPRRAWSGSTRPSARRFCDPLASIPLDMGDWVGKDEPVDADIVERCPDDRIPQPDVREPQAARASAAPLDQLFALWRPTCATRPKICLPSGGWTKIESLTRVLAVPLDSGPVDRRSRGWVTAR